MSEDHKVYVVIKHRVIKAVITLLIVFFLGIVSSFQYANYVDKKSNKRWCDLVGLFNESYTALPPPTDLGKKIAAAMLVIERDFDCE